MALFESGEMYLENILVLRKSGRNVRAVDLSEHMGYSRASVSNALSRLKTEGFLTVAQDGELLFTEKGEETAEKIYERHVVLTDFLVCLGVSQETAQPDACRIEHVISEETFHVMKETLRKLREG